MEKYTPADKTPFVDDSQVKELFGDGCAGVTVTNGVLKLTFTTVHADHSKTPAEHSAVVSARLALPIPTAVDLHQTLGEIIDQLKKQGAIQVVPQGPKTVQ